jgi:hypothetical protein
VSKKADKKPDKKPDKKAKSKKGDTTASAAPSVAGHPRARAQVRRAKGWGGLVGFGIAAYVSLNAGVPAADAGLRALAAGLAGYMLAWVCAVTVWRHLVMAELRAAVEGPGPVRAKAPAGGGAAAATFGEAAESGN